MILSIKGLKKSYGKYLALDGLDMELPYGSLYGFVGSNGAGKTTTMKIIVGLLEADAGEIWMDGENLLKHPDDMRERIGYVPDEFGVYDNLKVKEYLDFFASCYGMDGFNARKRYMTLLDQVGLGDKADYFVDGLSRGMKQRLSLARAMIHNPRLLIMDEPMSGLDPRTRLEFRQIMEDLCEQGKSILISSHVLPDIAEMCTNIGIIEQGRLQVTGSMEEIMSRINDVKPLIIHIVGNVKLAMELLREHPQVKMVSVKGQELRIGFTGSEEDEVYLLKGLMNQGCMVNGFVREPVNLEHAFMQLTGHQKEKVVMSYENESDSESGL